MEFTLLEMAKRLPKPKLVDLLNAPMSDEEIELLVSYIARNYSPKEIKEAFDEHIESLMPRENNILEDLPFIEAGAA